MIALEKHSSTISPELQEIVNKLPNPLKIKQEDMKVFCIFDNQDYMDCSSFLSWAILEETDIPLFIEEMRAWSGNVTLKTKIPVNEVTTQWLSQQGLSSVINDVKRALEGV